MQPHLRLALGGMAVLAVAGVATAAVAWRQGAWQQAALEHRVSAGSPERDAVVGLTAEFGQRSADARQLSSSSSVRPVAGEPQRSAPVIRTRRQVMVPAEAAGSALLRVARHHRSTATDVRTTLRAGEPSGSATADGTAGEHGDAPLRAAGHPFERQSASDLQLNDPGRELAIWYDPAQFPAGPVRFSLPDQGPACVLTVRGSDSIVERARLDGVPVVPGRSYVVEPGMRFEAPAAVDLQIRPAKPADLPGTPQGAG